jgi:hypothetical protein
MWGPVRQFVKRYTLNVNRSGIPTINESRFTNNVLCPHTPSLSRQSREPALLLEADLRGHRIKTIFAVIH